MNKQKNTLIDKSGRELAAWEGSQVPSEIKKLVIKIRKCGGKVVVKWD